MTNTAHRAVFLDRDGVLSESLFFDGKPRAPRKLEDFRIYPEAKGACERLKKAGWHLVVVTNQPDLGTGKVSADVVGQMHARLAAALPIDAVEVCPHTDADHCSCRKPLPGLLVRAAERLGLALPDSVMVGDRWRDIAAGKAAGCRTILVDRKWPERREQPDLVVADIGVAAEAIEAGL